MALPRNTLALLAALLACAFVAGPAQAVSYNVNTTVDQGDFITGDTVCDVNPEVSGDQCTLRAAVEDARGLPADAFMSINVSPEKSMRSSSSR